MASRDPCQCAFEVGEFGLGVGHPQTPAVLARLSRMLRPERAESAVLLLERLHQVKGQGRLTLPRR